MRNIALFVAACLTGSSLTLNAALWDGSEQHDGGWLKNDTFGWVHENPEGWVYLPEHGFQNAVGETTDSVYFYEPTWGSWKWSSADAYPYFYKYGFRAGWYQYQEGGELGEREFLRLSDGEIYHESKLAEPMEVVIDMVEVEGGSLPQLTVLGPLNVSTYEIGKYEITWGQWRAVVDWGSENGYDLEGIGEGCNDDHPVHSISWYDCIKWCNAKSEMDGLTPVYTYISLGVEDVYRRALRLPIWNRDADGYRLPDVFEWEFAARGGNLTQNFIYSGGDKPGPVAWFFNNSANSECGLYSWSSGPNMGTHPVGSKKANELGIHDMSGNLDEWNWDEDPTRPGERITIGGSWFSTNFTLKLAGVVGGWDAASRDNVQGWRIARNASE